MNNDTKDIKWPRWFKVVRPRLTISLSDKDRLDRENIKIDTSDRLGSWYYDTGSVMLLNEYQYKHYAHELSPLDEELKDYEIKAGLDMHPAVWASHFGIPSFGRNRGVLDSKGMAELEASALSKDALDALAKAISAGVNASNAQVKAENVSANPNEVKTDNPVAEVKTDSPVTEDVPAKRPYNRKV